MISSVGPSESVVRKAMNEFQIDVNSEQIAQIREYIRLLLMWNEKVNLTGIRDPLEILYRHFCESMFANKVADLEKCRLADIGTGAGFPGLALKILIPKAQVVLVEPNLKKATFLGEVVRSLGFSGVTVLARRYEELSLAPVDFVLARALGEFQELLGWARSEQVAAGRMILWVGTSDVDKVREMAGWEWDSPVAVPQSERRVLLVGSKSS